MANWCHNAFLFPNSLDASVFRNRGIPNLGFVNIELISAEVPNETEGVRHITWCYSQWAPVKVNHVTERHPNLSFVHFFEDPSFGHGGFKLQGSVGFDLPSEQVAPWNEGGDPEEDTPTELNPPKGELWVAIYDRLDLFNNRMELVQHHCWANSPEEAMRSLLWEEGVSWDSLVDGRVTNADKLPIWVYISPFEGSHGQPGMFLRLRSIQLASQQARELQNIHNASGLSACLDVVRTTKSI